jgi:hypothetical protein
VNADLYAELEAAFRDVVARLHGQFTTLDAVAELKIQFADLWTRAADELATDYVRAIGTRILRRSDILPEPDQLFLPGFEHLPRLIRCKGKYIAIEDANLDQLQTFKAWYDSRLQVLLKLTEKFGQTGKELDRLIRLVERYAASYPAITVQGVFALRAITEPQRAARMRNLTADERAAIARMGAEAKWRIDGED